MVVQHNMPSMRAKRYLGKNNSALGKTLEKLSSGYGINRAADDAAGLAVSEKMRSQIHGMEQAVKNSTDGISLIQTFEGALGEIHTIIKRCKSLADQAANGTYDDPVDRKAIHTEYEQLISEVDHLSDTDFNRLCMLNGGVQRHCREIGYSWDPPADLDWVENSFVNNTNNANFTMSIKKLPAMDDMTILDKEQVKAIEEFAHSRIGVSLNDGHAKLYFIEPNPAKDLTIEMSGATKGIVYANSLGEPVPIAEIELSEISTKAATDAYGNWTSSSGYVSYTSLPTSNVTKATMVSPRADKYVDTGKPDENDNQAARTEYHDWVKSIPTAVKFRITDDRKHFTIVGDPKYFSVKDKDGNITQCDNKTEYSIDTTLIMKTDNKGGKTSTVDHTWDDAKIKINWTPDSVRPGTTINMSTRGCGYFADTDPDCGSSTYIYVNNKRVYVYYNLDIGDSIGTNCQPSGTSNYGGDDKEHGFWLEHGGYTFDLIYTQGNAANNKWSLVVGNNRGERKTYTKKDNPDQFNGFLNKFHISDSKLKSVATKIEAAHVRGYFENESSAGPDAHHFLTRSSYTFDLDFSGPSLTSNGGSYWSQGNKNYSLILPKYNPDNADRGGIDYDMAVSGTYTYKNDDKVNTLQKGHWENENGEEVNLEDVGIYLPAAYKFDTLKSEEYKSGVKEPLHDGLRIIVSQSITGPTGDAHADVELNDDFELLTETDPSLTFAENLILQVGARTKDAVNFTFKYDTGSIGDLECDLDCSASGLGLDSLSLLTQESANYSIDMLDHALNKVSLIRATFGATQNRLEHKVDNLNSSIENLTSAESKIRDADMAKEMMNFTKQQILSQASQSMLAQADSLPQGVLSLLGGQNG